MLLSVKDLCVEFRDKVAVDHVNFQVDENEIVGIIGESGSGKSVSALSVMGLLNDDAKVSGSALFDGKDLSELKLRGPRGPQRKMGRSSPCYLRLLYHNNSHRRRNEHISASGS